MRATRALTSVVLKEHVDCRVVTLVLLGLLVPLEETWGDKPHFGARISEVAPADCGIDFIHTDGASGRRYIMETVLGSLALFDYDGDGFVDIYFVNGAGLPGSNLPSPPTNRLYRNNGNWTFTDVTEASGLGDTGYGMGVVVGDFDQDGDADVFISNFGKNAFYINQGDGTFICDTEVCGLDGPVRFGAGNSFFDMDLDGDLDLYCGSYVEFDYASHHVRTIAGHEFHVGPNAYPPATDILYRNNGDGTFSDVSAASGVAALRAPAMGVLAADFNGDGSCDVFVANDQRPNFLWVNDGHGNFTEEALLHGLAYDRNGIANGNMGVELADINGDGLQDLVSTTYQEEMPVYYEADGSGFFTDRTNLARIDTGLTAHVNWGVGAVDFDNDTDRDLFLACGHFLDNLRFIDDRTSVQMHNYLLANDGQGSFTNETAQAGSAMAVVESSRGAGFDDLDNDGDVDVIVLNANAPPTIGRNDLLNNNRQLTVRLVGTRSNRDGVGAVVTVRSPSNPQPQVQVAVAGRGYESYYGQRLYFGLGGDEVAAVEVMWPGGRKEMFDAVDAKSAFPLIEGQGRVE